ncbi:MAG TPA: hypothetical protein VN203_13535 [Candidatus Acidoferrum sp.]|nr:hypothetical protein [Candidatus Acidoferrum sp.]
MKHHNAENELGRMLAAAYVASITRRKSIDRVLQNDIPEEISGFWRAMAKAIFAQHASLPGVVVPAMAQRGKRLQGRFSSWPV